jgi:hypothetical protein
MVYDYAVRAADRRAGGTTAARGAAVRSGVLELQRLAGNRAVSGLLGRTVQRERDDDIYDKPPPEKVTGYLGLNPQAGKEAAALRGASREKVLVSLNDPAAEQKLRESPAIFDFVDGELGIDPLDDYARWDKATDILLNADPHLREQLADLMRWFNRAEKGEIVIDRLVLSGHSNGVELWGEAEADAGSKPGTMVIERDLHALANVFPTAAGQVEDVMFSACFSINAVELVIRMFPNLKSCWSYSSFSPDIAGGSGRHIAAWSTATEGARTPGKTDKRGSSAIWVKGKGYLVGDPSQAAVGPLFADAVGAWRDVAEPMFHGDKDVPKASLDPVYGKIQALLAHPSANADMRKSGEAARDIVLRLRFWPAVRERFGTEYAGELKTAYEALGVPQPEWRTLTRVALKAHIETLNKAIEAHADQAAAKEIVERLVKNGLNGLDTKIIKSDWI